MPLIVEDGTDISCANSYIDLEDIRTFASNRNYDISTFDDSALEGWAFRAMDYLESFRDRFKGSKTNANQDLQFPRKVNPDPIDVWTTGFRDSSQSSLIEIDGIPIPNNVIPVLVKNAQCQLVIELSRGVDLLPTTFPNKNVQKQTVGPITTVYFDNDPAPLLPAFEAFITPLLAATGGAFITTVRV